MVTLFCTCVTSFSALECLTSLRPALSYRPLAKQAAEVAHSAGHRTWICETECLPLHLGRVQTYLRGTFFLQKMLQIQKFRATTFQTPTLI